MTAPLDVAIIGGGLAGLCVAHRLREIASDRVVAVFEASGRAGGKLLTERIEFDDGQFLIEAGPDAFLAQKPWAAELAVELGLAGQIVPVNSLRHPVAVLKNGRRHDLPEGISLVAPTRIGPFLRTGLLSPGAKIRAAADLALRPRRSADDESLAAFVTRRFGPDLLDWVAEPLAAGIYNADPDRMSMLATFPQLCAIERQHGSLIRGLRKTGRREQQTNSQARDQSNRRADEQAGSEQSSPLPLRKREAGGEGYQSADGPAPRPSPFLTFRHGMQSLTDALTDRIGDALHPDAPVAAIEHLPAGGYRLRFDDRPSIEAAVVVLATPAATAAGLLPDIAPLAAATLARLRATHAGAISLAVRDTDIARPLPGYGLVIPRRERRPINAVTIASRKIPGRAFAGWNLIRVFFGGARSPATMELGDDALLELVNRELTDLIGLGSPPAFHRIHRWSSGSPQYDVGHLDRLASIDSALPEGIVLTGSPYRGVGIPDVIYQARIAADNIVRTLTRRFAERAA